MMSTVMSGSRAIPVIILALACGDRPAHQEAGQPPSASTMQAGVVATPTLEDKYRCAVAGEHALQLVKTRDGAVKGEIFEDVTYFYSSELQSCLMYYHHVLPGGQIADRKVVDTLSNRDVLFWGGPLGFQVGLPSEINTEPDFDTRLKRLGFPANEKIPATVPE
jgi:hypothetical protein